jgi:hypothetical protein
MTRAIAFLYVRKTFVLSRAAGALFHPTLVRKDIFQLGS